MDLQFTAVYRKVPEGFIAFVEELPGANAGCRRGALHCFARRGVERRLHHPGVHVIQHGNISPGRDPSVYAFTKISAHRNLYRVPVP